MILAGFAFVVLVLSLIALRDELRDGGSLSLLARRDDSEIGRLLEFPRPDSWSEDDVLRTYAEISSL